MPAPHSTLHGTVLGRVVSLVVGRWSCLSSLRAYLGKRLSFFFNFRSTGNEEIINAIQEAIEERKGNRLRGKTSAPRAMSPRSSSAIGSQVGVRCPRLPLRIAVLLQHVWPL